MFVKTPGSELKRIADFDRVFKNTLNVSLYSLLEVYYAFSNSHLLIWVTNIKSDFFVYDLLMDFLDIYP